MFFISGKAKTHFWKCICWHLDVDCQGWEMKHSNVEAYPACWYDTGSVKFGCHLWKGVEKRFEWQWPQVTITQPVMADSQLRSWFWCLRW